MIASATTHCQCCESYAWRRLTNARSDADDALFTDNIAFAVRGPRRTSDRVAGISSGFDGAILSQPPDYDDRPARRRRRSGYHGKNGGGKKEDDIGPAGRRRERPDGSRHGRPEPTGASR